MKFKPTCIPITKALLKAKEPGWAILAGIFEVAIAAEKAKRGIKYWACGNPRCAVPLQLRTSIAPRVCSKCGGEIDWVGIKTRLIKVCPICNKVVSFDDTYCDLHVPAVKLITKEVPL